MGDERVEAAECCADRREQVDQAHERRVIAREAFDAIEPPGVKGGDVTFQGRHQLPVAVRLGHLRVRTFMAREPGDASLVGAEGVGVDGLDQQAEEGSFPGLEHRWCGSGVSLVGCLNFTRPHNYLRRPPRAGAGSRVIAVQASGAKRRCQRAAAALSAGP